MRYITLDEFRIWVNNIVNVNDRLISEMFYKFSEQHLPLAFDDNGNIWQYPELIDERDMFTTKLDLLSIVNQTKCWDEDELETLPKHETDYDIVKCFINELQELESKLNVNRTKKCNEECKYFDIETVNGKFYQNVCLGQKDMPRVEYNQDCECIKYDKRWRH